MPSPEPEHYGTLFDIGYLAQGLCLHESLVRFGGAFRLWILCIDEAVEAALRRLALPHVELLPLREVEDARLLAVKPGRSRGEYCWTLTPFLPSAILARDATVRRVTYLDADLWFLDSPRGFLDELAASGKDVLITEHAYDPRYDDAANAGRFCVQFVTFARSARADEVLAWWQERCLEWCFNRVEPGRFGDQKYLDEWPTRFGDRVHVLAQTRRTLAPWNVDHAAGLAGGTIDPVFFHFHTLKAIAPRLVMLWHAHYTIGAAGRRVYRGYAERFAAARARIAAAGIRMPTPPPPAPAGWRDTLRRLRRRLRDPAAFVRVEA